MDGISTYDGAGSGDEGPSDPDAHGQAALLLVESLIHGLIARSALSVPDAIDIVDIAADVKVGIADEEGDLPDTLRKSLNLLHAMRESLALDL